MRKYRLELAPNVGFDLDLSSVKKFFRGDFNGAFRLFNKLALAGILLWVVSLPLLVWQFTAVLPVPRATFAVTLESLLLYSLLLLAAWLVMLSIGRVAAGGFDSLIDPKFFLAVLIYAFLVITSYLLLPGELSTDGASRLNTFGIAGVRYLSGIAAMIFVSLFYLLALFVNTGRKIVWVARCFGVALALVAVVFALSVETRPMLAAITGFLVPVFFVHVIYSHSVVRRLLSLLGIVVGLWALFSYNSAWFPQLAVIIGSIIWLWVWILNSGLQINFRPSAYIREFKQVLTTRRGLNTILQSYAPLYVIKGLLIFSLVSLAWLFVGKQDLLSSFELIVTNIQRAFASLTDFRTLLFGLGTDFSRYASTVSYVISFSGLAGLVAYLTLGIAGYYATIKLMLMEIRDDKGYRFGIVLAPFMFIIPLYSLIGVLTTLEVAVWWMAFGLISARLSMMPESSFSAKQPKRKVVRYFRTVLMLSVIPLALLILRFMYDLVVSGLI